MSNSQFVNDFQESDYIKASRKQPLRTTHDDRSKGKIGIRVRGDSAKHKRYSANAQDAALTIHDLLYSN